MIGISSVLISGTSHTGKSTLASSICEASGWAILSTDRLGRHPGRPWPTVRPHVAEFFASLSDETIYQLLLHHHENMWPLIERLLLDHRWSEKPLVLEGSALRPEYLKDLASKETAMICLYSDHDFLRDRMQRQSGFDRLDERHRGIVRKFIQRSLHDNDRNLAAAREHGLHCIDVRDLQAVDALRAELIERTRCSHPSNSDQHL